VTAKSKSAQKVNSQKVQPTPKYQYDVIVIGTGPGGEGAAMNLTKAGKKVAVIEKH
jgi:NAD(P) transhydrogenase